MELPRHWRGATPVGEALAADLDVVMFDRVRKLLVSNRLPPTPPVYELLWQYLTDDNHALAHAVDLAIITQTFDEARATALHSTHCRTGPPEYHLKLTKWRCWCYAVPWLVQGKSGNG